MKTLLLLTLAFLSAHAHALRPLRLQDFTVSPPPRAGSSEESRDFRLLEQHQETRSSRDCALGDQYNHGPGVFTFRNLFGDLLTHSELTVAAPLMQEALLAANSLANGFKRRYARTYPFEYPGLRSCVGEGKGDGSYPSGHATVGTAVACLLAELYPRKAEKILERGKFHGDIRVVIGRHFQSDVEEGQRLGQQVCRAIQQDPEFAELRKSLR